MKKNDYLEELKEMAGEFDDEPKSNGADSEENAAAEEKPAESSWPKAPKRPFRLPKTCWA